ncbi:hypothetical protein HPP92_007659 [Vanilla planifolia]|uniref:Uncharacterized protein n=1 Tax=Vanilla planifolia TaxID=51239 RepID=A0A835REA7_VANPL|nr:hypothetical protein HPP92_007659 [Vanilla planifolia]
MVAEVMRRLEREIRCPSPPPPPPPAINMRQELCGPSFSDSASTVMASVDTRPGGGGASNFYGDTEAAIRGWNVSLVGNRAAWKPVAEVCSRASDEEDEDWLDRVLSQSWVEIEDSLFLNGDGN